MTITVKVIGSLVLSLAFITGLLRTLLYFSIIGGMICAGMFINPYPFLVIGFFTITLAIGLKLLLED